MKIIAEVGSNFSTMHEAIASVEKAKATEDIRQAKALDVE